MNQIQRIVGLLCIAISLVCLGFAIYALTQGNELVALSTCFIGLLSGTIGQTVMTWRAK